MQISCKQHKRKSLCGDAELMSGAWVSSAIAAIKSELRGVFMIKSTRIKMGGEKLFKKRSDYLSQQRQLLLAQTKTRCYKNTKYGQKKCPLQQKTGFSTR